MTLCVVYVMLLVPRWTFGLFISPCELVLSVIAKNEKHVALCEFR